MILRWMGSSTPPRPPAGRHAHAHPGGGIGHARIETHRTPARPGAHAHGGCIGHTGGAYTPYMSPARPYVSDSVAPAMRAESNQDNVSVCICLCRLVAPGRVYLGLSQAAPKSGNRLGQQSPAHSGVAVPIFLFPARVSVCSLWGCEVDLTACFASIALGTCEENVRQLNVSRPNPNAIMGLDMYRTLCHIR